MQKITLPTHAKINLALDILGIESGFHLIQTVYQKIDLHDEVTIEIDDSGRIECDGKLTSQAAEKFFKKIHSAKEISKKGTKISIKKNIPYYSGLGGASSNAAAVLRGLNTLFKNTLSQDDLIKIAEELGMDVAFFVSGYDTALGTHFGEKIEKLPDCPKFAYRLHFSDAGKTSTKDMYEKIDLKKCAQNKEKTQKLIEGLKKRDKKIILENLHNDFDQLWKNPHETSHIKNQKWLLCGSGPTWIEIKPE